MDRDSQNLDAALDGLDEDKRSTLKRLIGTGAFVGPLVVSFTMADLTIDAFMHAASANMTTTHNLTTPINTTPINTTPGPGPTTTPHPTTTLQSTTTPRPTTTLSRGHPAKS